MKNELLGKLPPFRNKNRLVTEYQQTKDIIKELLKGHEIYSIDYDKISDRFWKGSVIKSCRYVFNFLKNNIRYKIEPDTRQSIKSPSAIIATGNNGYNDCKHYSSFFGGLIDSWSRKNKAGKPINWVYRFANYKLFNDQPHHVFVVVKLGGTEYWCDAVLNSFNYQKPYVNKIDKKPKNMALYQISGIGCSNCYGKCQEENEFNFGTPMISGKANRKARRQEKRQKRRSGENCTGRTALKITLSPARQAFLGLVKLNFRGFATKLNKTLEGANRLKLLEKWCSAGGNAKTLKIAISQGIRKKRLGMLGFAVASALAAAAGIIALLKPFLGEKGQEIAEGAETAIESGKEILETESENGGQTTSGIETNYIWGAAALAGIYLLTRKK